MKTIRLICCVLFALAAFAAGAQDAETIVRNSRNRISADTVQSRSRMVITAKNGAVTERRIDQYSKDGPKGDRKVIIFQYPESVANTRYLTMENGAGHNDQWIFLPNLGRVRRIAASEGSGSFVGTDLSYDDIASTDRDAGLDIHTLLREENHNGRPCYVIQSIPKDSSYQYSKMILWIDRENWVSHKIDLYDKRGILVKTMEILELKTVQGILSPWRTKMTTLAAGTSTTINVEILEYNKNIPESVFTTSYLETGRAR
ncbi:MAG: outer membrane lipoprotein-sorting protein [Treponema sp.]|jgi:outer membrane lipoprotein-sorting protein|nr:outer membrane lipoprotein-sorting protein [Treponema sp.]